MGRTVRNRNEARPRPVQKIELSGKHLGWRLLAVILLLAIGASALSYAFITLFSSEPGWVEIKANEGDPSYAANFILLYNVGASGASASAENKALTGLYTQAATKAWQLFNNTQTAEDVPNVRYLNDHPNETIAVDEALYKAFEQVARSGNRALYLAPVAELYDNLFLCADDVLTVDFDPLLNPELRAFFAESAEFANDPAAINVELLEDNQVRLSISDAYLAYAEEQEIRDFIDFHWMLDAFVIDYLADALAAQGFTYGTLSSYDGFARALDNRAGNSYAYNLYDGQDGTVRQAAIMHYSGARSIVTLRGYPLNDLDTDRYYVRQDGQIHTAYLDVADGLSRAALADLVAYTSNMSCAEMLLQVAPLYIADALAEDALTALSGAGIQTIYCRGSEIRYTDPKLILSNLFDADGIAYTATLMEP